MISRVRMLSTLSAALLVLAFTQARADEYRVSVTRDGSNVYRVVGQDIRIQTWGCFEFAYSEDALLRMSGRRGTLVFLDRGTKCNVTAVYGKTQVPAGTYSVTVTREADDWYSILGMETKIHTYACLKYWYAKSLTLVVRSDGYAFLYDDDDSPTLVDGFYAPMNL